MSKTQTLQERIEELALKELNDKLADLQFMLKYITIGDLALFIKLAREKDDNVTEANGSGFIAVLENRSFYFSRLRNIMCTRMFPEALDIKTKEIMAKIQVP